jgi:uncharacterized repeat protein (TIGR03803 family)
MLGVGALMAATLTPCSGSAASQQKVLYSFCTTERGYYCTDGEYPAAGLIEDASGNFYGTTAEGGADGGGTVFELTLDKAKTAWVHKVLYRFCAQGGGNCTDGAEPEADLIRDALSGHLYGTTYEGGAGGEGTVFALTPPAAGQTAWREKVLYSFCQQTDCVDGAYPEAGLIEDASGNLYGTTYDGGTFGEGAVFELTPPAAGQTAWTEIVLYSFCSLACTDGESPEARLLRDALSGNLYGTTYYGGANDRGVVFELMPPAPGQTAWTEVVLYSFCALGGGGCADGANPGARLIGDPSGNLYGTTTGGGAYGGGTVFELTPPAPGQTTWTEIVLRSFCAHGGRDCTDGAYPYAGLIRDAKGNLYGTTEDGGANGGGAVFELTPPAPGQTAWTEKVLYSFCAQGGRDYCTDGAFPEAGLIRDAKGNLYGTTEDGGAYYGGVVFELVTGP